MSYEVFLAFRYLRSRHKRRLARVTALVAITGIAMGVAALIIALALSNGFRDEMRAKILEGTSHINVLRTDSLPINDRENVAAKVRQIDGVVSASATTYDGAVARGPKGSAYAVLRGVETAAGETAALKHWLITGSMFSDQQSDREPETVVGVELANRLGLTVGDVLQIIPAGSATNTSNVQTRRLRVAGIFRSGLFEYDSTWIYLPLQVATSFANDNHSASIVSVQIKNADDVKGVAAKIRETLGPGYNTIDWQQANQPLFAALALERRMGMFIIGLIIAIAALNITTMLILVVIERRRDIAVLRTLGAKQTGVMLVFIIEGAVVGAVGALIGTIIGLIACGLGNYYKLVSLPADVYSISNVPLNARLSETLIAALVAFVLSVLATLYPARAAAKMRPVDTLRDAG
ncbi:MAG TPA: ABC transporter permease [Pyrinomonadaceae bacterium]